VRVVFLPRSRVGGVCISWSTIGVQAMPTT